MIRRQRPCPGCRHPASPQEIREFLQSIGPEAAYGLKTIVLRPESAQKRDRMVFGEYRAPDAISLYAVPASPWRLPFLLSDTDLAIMQRYGARVQTDPASGQTSIAWDAAALRAFCLGEVLAHELGHHRRQYDAGKRTVPTCRHSDHERCAERYAARMRERLFHTPSPASPR